MESKREFWMAWSDNGNTPTVKHESEDSARRESARLGRCHPGEVFWVLKAIGASCKRDVDWVSVEGAEDSIPF